MSKIESIHVGGQTDCMNLLAAAQIEINQFDLFQNLSVASVALEVRQVRLWSMFVSKLAWPRGGLPAGTRPGGVFSFKMRTCEHIKHVRKNVQKAPGPRLACAA